MNRWNQHADGNWTTDASRLGLPPGIEPRPDTRLPDGTMPPGVWFNGGEPWVREIHNGEVVAWTFTRGKQTFTIFND